MNNNTRYKVFNEKYLFAVVLLIVVMLFPFSSFAQSPGYMGGHMMNEEERDKMMEERGYPYGSGYGWMGNMGGGYGGYMMGGGPGWMGGGYGGYMMGGGPGMMGMMGGGYGSMMGALNQLDLTTEQRQKIRDIQRSIRKKNLSIMEKMMDRSDKLEELYGAEKLDTDKIGKAYDEFFKVKREMIMHHVEARNKVYEVLNKEQREKFKSYGSFGHMGGMMH